MIQISNWEAFLWLYIFLHLLSLGAVIWMTFVATTFGRVVQKIQIGNVIRLTVRKHNPEIVIGLLPMSAYVQLKEITSGDALKSSFAERAGNGFGQLILPLAFAAVVIGPGQMANGFLDTAKTYFISGLSPLNGAPEVLTAFWSHLRTSPMSAIANSAIFYAFINGTYHIWESSLRLNDDVDNTGWDKFRNTVAAIPLFFLLGWAVGFGKALF